MQNLTVEQTTMVIDIGPRFSSFRGLAGRLCRGRRQPHRHRPVCGRRSNGGAGSPAPPEATPLPLPTPGVTHHRDRPRPWRRRGWSQRCAWHVGKNPHARHCTSHQGRIGNAPRDPGAAADATRRSPRCRSTSARGVCQQQQGRRVRAAFTSMRRCDARRPAQRFSSSVSTAPTRKPAVLPSPRAWRCRSSAAARAKST